MSVVSGVGRSSSGTSEGSSVAPCTNGQSSRCDRSARAPPQAYSGALRARGRGQIRAVPKIRENQRDCAGAFTPPFAPVDAGAPSLDASVTASLGSPSFTGILYVLCELSGIVRAIVRYNVSHGLSE